MATEQRAESNCSSPSGSSSTPKGNYLTKGAHRRTPFSKTKNVHSSFKSPLQTSTAQRAEVPPEEEVEKLRRIREELNTQIVLLETEGCRVEELERHIDLLHEYNDIKDMGQTLLGNIAAQRGATTRDLYSHFGLDLND